MMPPTPRSLPFRVTGALVGLAVALAACGPTNVSPSPQPSSARTPAPSTTATPAASPSTGTPSPASTVPPGAFDPAAVAIDLQVVAEIDGSPVGVTNAGDGSNRLFVLDQNGRILIVRDGALVAQPFLDINPIVQTSGEQGLLGLAFHPNYPDDGRFFVYYTEQDGRQAVVSYRVSGDPDIADPNSATVMLRMDDFAGNHNGGSLAFGPDGLLTIATGDGGGGGDPRGSGQSLATYLGKILRVDVDSAEGERAYGIPGDNPFIATDGAFPEIWITGLRNPWRTSFDRTTGDFWIGDVGQNAFEEIDVVRAGTSGQNFGWNVTEGFHCYIASTCDTNGLVGPVTEYSHDFGCSVTGGYVYRGTAVPTLAGGYLFGDYCSGRIWAIDPTATETREPRVVLETGRNVSSFGEDEAGELYVADLGGSVLRVIPG